MVLDADRLTVFVPKPANLSYGEAMSRLRTWLESRKLRPSGFKLAERGRFGFEISFQSETDAAAAEEFTWRPL